MIVAEVLVEETIVKGKPTEVIYTLFFIIENDYYQVVLRYYSNCNYLLKIGKTRKEIFKNLLINGKLECSDGRVFHLNFNLILFYTEVSVQFSSVQSLSCV